MLFVLINLCALASWRSLRLLLDVCNSRYGSGCPQYFLWCVAGEKPDNLAVLVFFRPIHGAHPFVIAEAAICTLL